MCTHTHRMKYTFTKKKAVDHSKYWQKKNAVDLRNFNSWCVSQSVCSPQKWRSLLTNTVSSASCRPLLDCSFKDLKALLGGGGEIIHCFHNPAWMCALSRSLSHTFIKYSNQHTDRHTHTNARTHRRTHLMQVFVMFLITCRNGPPACGNHLPSLWRSLRLGAEQDLSHLNWIFDGLRAFEILWDLLAFSSPPVLFFQNELACQSA